METSKQGYTVWKRIDLLLMARLDDGLLSHNMHEYLFSRRHRTGKHFISLQLFIIIAE